MPLSRAARAVAASNGGIFSSSSRLVRSGIDTAPDIVVAIGAAGIHHQRATLGQRILDREMNLIRTTGDRPDRPHRRMDHHGVARRDTQGRESIGQFPTRIHELILSSLQQPPIRGRPRRDHVGNFFP